jgi:hypothetical protein
VQADDILNENPFFQHATTKQKGCQIDYMIQTKTGTLYLCEIKFSKDRIGLEIVKEMETKIERLKRPKGVSCRAVLIHVNGITDQLEAVDYFSKIIDFGRILGT